MGSVSVGNVVLAEEPDQRGLFVADAGGEEAVEKEHEETEGDRVEQQQLCAERPVEEADVAWVSQIGVDSVGDEDVAGLPACLDDVGEVFAGGLHGQRPEPLAADGEQQPEELHGAVALLERRTEPELEETLCERSTVCDVVEPSVVEDEGGRHDAVGLERRCAEVLEEVEGGDEEDVEGQGPEAGAERRGHGQRERCAGDDAEHVGGGGDLWKRVGVFARRRHGWWESCGCREARGGEGGGGRKRENPKCADTDGYLRTRACKKRPERIA